MNSMQKRQKLEAEYEVEEILNTRLTDEGKLEYFLKWKGFPKSENTWEPVENLNCPELVKVYEAPIKSESSEKKRKLKNAKTDDSGCYPKKKIEVRNLNDASCDINCLPKEIFLKIFAYLRQNELGRMAQVCKRFNIYVRSPMLWRKVSVKFRRNGGSLNKVVSFFSENLPTCATELKLNFSSPYYWLDRLHFQEFCMNLQKKCPRLQSLILFYAKISVRLPSAIDICAHFLPHLEVLSFRDCLFGNNTEGEYDTISNVKVLDLYSSHFRNRDFKKSLVCYVPCLKKLYLSLTHANDFWLADTVLLRQLEVLQLGFTKNVHTMFQTLKNHALNITALLLCSTGITDNDLRFTNESFPCLRTICLRYADVTSVGIFFLIQSCPSLQNVYVSEEVAKKYAAHPYIATNKRKRDIVKAFDICYHRLDLLYKL